MMKLNVKPGDMAIVLSALDTPEMVGMIVEVVRVADDWVDPDIHEWTCKSDRISVAWNEETGSDNLALDFDIPDAWIRPISGLPMDEETRDEVAA